jgi:hypothetical protein
VYVNRLAERIRAVAPLGAAILGAVGVCGCDTLARNNYFLPGGIDQRSPVAAQVRAAEQQPGAYPQFAEIPALPTDIRPLGGWRAAVGGTLADKQATDAEIREHPFTLNDTEGFAAATRGKIPPHEAVPPTDDTAAAEAFAASVRGRANPPPSPR